MQALDFCIFLFSFHILISSAGIGFEYNKVERTRDKKRINSCISTKNCNTIHKPTNLPIKTKPSNFCSLLETSNKVSYKELDLNKESSFELWNNDLSSKKRYTSNKISQNDLHRYLPEKNHNKMVTKLFKNEKIKKYELNQGIVSEIKKETKLMEPTDFYINKEKYNLLFEYLNYIEMTGFYEAKELILKKMCSDEFLSKIFFECKNKERIRLLSVSLKSFIVETDRLEIIPLLFTYIRMESNFLINLESNFKSGSFYKRAGIMKIYQSQHYKELLNICQKYKLYKGCNEKNISEYLSEPCIRSFYISMIFFSDKIPNHKPKFDDMMNFLNMNINENSNYQNWKIYEEWRDNYVIILNMIISRLHDDI